MSVKMCSDCGVGMEIGFVPDRGINGVVPASWFAGVPEVLKVFGFSAGGGLSLRSKVGIPVKAYRCPECGVLKFYAEK